MGVIAFAICIARVFFMMALISKLFNVRVVNRSGRTVVQPNSFDGMRKIPGVIYKDTLTRIKKIDINSYNITSLSLL